MDLVFNIKLSEKEITIIFKFICDITLMSESGKILTYSPCKEEKNIIRYEGKEVHNYGEGPFCKFKIPRGLSGKSGVYIIKVNGIIHYVGETGDLQHRFNAEYGSIKDRNCYKGGPMTTCRINNLILQESMKGSKIKLYFYEVIPSHRKNIESFFIQKESPSWNKTVT